MNGNKLTLVVAVVAVSGCFHSGSTTAPLPTRTSPAVTYIDPSRLLAPGSLEVDVMGPSPRFAELSLKFTSGIRKNPEWFLDFVRDRAEPGQPLPYHEKMGLSREEYNEFLALTKQKSFVKSGTTALTITRLPDGSLAIDGGKNLPELTGIEFDFQKNQVRTAYGIADQRDDGDAENAMLGDWNGAQWKFNRQEESGRESAATTSITVILGQLQATGRGILVYDVQVAGSQRKRITYILNFDPPVSH